MSQLLKIANNYGNVDIECRVPKGYQHVPGKRLQPLCRKLGIRYADALVGWGGTRQYPKPLLNGVVVTRRSASRLVAEIEERNRRNPPERRQQAAIRRQIQKDQRNSELEEMGIDPSGRTALWLKHGEVDEYEARLIAFKVAYRHEHTDYDQIIRSLGRDDARDLAEEAPIPSDWIDYLAKYPFPYPDVADALSRALQNPQHAHPIWFCKAILAVKRDELPLHELTYELIRDAVNRF